MLTGTDRQHDLVICQHGADGHKPSAECFTQDDDIRSYIFVIATKHATRPAKPGLDLIRNEEDMCFPTHRRRTIQITFIRDHHTRFPLDGLHQETGHMWVCQCLRQGRQVIVGDDLKARHVRTKTSIGRRIRAEGDHRTGPAMEVAGTYDDPGLPIRDALYGISPPARQFQRRFHGLHTGVHRQYLVISK